MATILFANPVFVSKVMDFLTPAEITRFSIGSFWSMITVGRRSLCTQCTEAYMYLNHCLGTDRSAAIEEYISLRHSCIYCFLHPGMNLSVDTFRGVASTSVLVDLDWFRFHVLPYPAAFASRCRLMCLGYQGQ